MSAAEVAIRMSRLERPAGIGPAERLTEDVVEVVNEIEHASLEILERGKTCALEQSSREDGEPDLDLVEPRAVSWGVDEADPTSSVVGCRRSGSDARNLAGTRGALAST